MGIITKILTAITAVRDILSLARKLWTDIQVGRSRAQAEEAKEAVDEAIETGDQRRLEEALGTDNAGKPTRHNIDGVQYRSPEN